MSQPNASPMGQIVLGFRSLAVKVAVFVALAALLAWILGGTLWPRSVVRLVGEPVGSYQLVAISTEAPRASFGLATVDDKGKVTVIEPKEGEPTWDLAQLRSTDGGALYVIYQASGTWVALDPVTGKHAEVGGDDALALWLAQAN